MSMRYKGGVISATAPTTTGGTTGVASGIWTLESQMQAQGSSVWPVPLPAATNPPFYDVTMLLTGNGTNGAQNNTFLDSSSNTYTITRNGNVTQGSFSPYGSNWSNYFNGTDSSFQMSSDAVFQYGTGDFTIEFWLLWGATGNHCVFSTADLNTANSLQLYTDSDTSTQYKITAQFSGSPEYQAQTGYTTKNVWHHFALVRTSGTSQWYVDGVASGSSASTPKNLTVSSAPKVGDMQLSSTHYYYKGFISNLRSTKGGALYSGTFTPSTTPLTTTVSSGTVGLLTCQSNSLKDNSVNNFTIQVNGTPLVQRFSPFNPTASYSTATIGGSGYFSRDGASSLYTASNSSWDLGSDNFTIEAWVYPTLDASSVIITRAANGSVYPTFELTIYAGTWRFYSSSSSSSYNINLDSGVAPKLNQWQHVAVTRSGSTYTIWINGVSANTASSSDSLYANSNTVGIGAYPDNVNRLKGYISDLRLVKGTAVYTTTFTPPTAPLTAVSGTQLLLNMTNAGIPDSAMMNDLETVGNAQVSTSQSKWGGGALYFDGTGDYLKGVSNPIYAFGKGNFTIECWIYLPTTPSGDYACILDTRTAGGSSSNSILFAVNSGLGITVDPGISTSGNFTTNTWYHVALCQASGVMVAYVNGTSVASYTNTDDRTTTGCYIGQVVDAAHPAFNGYIDDLRITKGYAVYTENFAPPAAAFPTY